MRNLIIGIIVLVLLVVGGIFLFTNRNNSNPNSILGISTSTTPASGQPAVIEATEFAFTPNTLTVQHGQPVTIQLKNAGTTAHDITSTDLNFQSAVVQPGDSTTVSFTPQQPGTYTFFCNIDGHRANGMVGTITVQ